MAEPDRANGNRNEPLRTGGSGAQEDISAHNQAVKYDVYYI